MSVSIEHSVQLTVWRRKDHVKQAQPNANEYSYVLVGMTPLYQPFKLRTHTITLTPQQHIQVKTGDVIGFYFPQHNPIGWTSVPCATNRQKYLLLEAPATLAVNKIYTFTSASGLAQPDNKFACRKYSFKALLGKN